VHGRTVRKMLHRLFFCATLVLAAGCAAAPPVEPPGVETEADYDALWQAALDAVTLRFHVASAQKGSGSIATDYLVGALSETGFKSNAVGARAAGEDFLHTIRRRAFVEISRAEHPLAVRVEKERLIRRHPEIVRDGTFSVGRDIEAGEPGARGRWVPAGDDEALAARMTEEIVRRYRAALENRNTPQAPPENPR